MWGEMVNQGVISFVSWFLFILCVADATGTECKQRLRVVLETADEEDAGTTGDVDVMFLDILKFSTTINRVTTEMTTYKKPLLPGRIFTRIVEFYDMDSDASWNLSVFSIMLNGGSEWKLNNVLIQDGGRTHLFEWNDWIKPDTRTETLLTHVDSFDDKVELSPPCPNNSESVIGVEGRCFEYIEEEQGFEEAIDTCTNKLGYRGRLIDPEVREDLEKVQLHYYLEKESVHWTGIANLKMTAGDFELKSREWRDVHSYQSFNFQANIWKSEEAGNGSGLMCGCAKVADEGFLMKCNCNRKYPFVCETKDFY